MPEPTTTSQLLAFVKANGIVRPRDVEEAGFSSRLLYRLRDRGELTQLAPGLFKHPESEISNNHTYAEVAKRVPHGVVCLVSALAFHDIGVQMPRTVWMALNRDRTRKLPRLDEIPATFVWFSGPAFEEGQEVHEVEGIQVRVYSPGKTVADLFKFRNKVGTEVAIEGLTEAWRERLFTMDELDHYAEICGVSEVMRPYLEVLVSSP